jgi:hypothetical protein
MGDSARNLEFLANLTHRKGDGGRQREAIMASNLKNRPSL